MIAAILKKEVPAINLVGGYKKLGLFRLPHGVF